MQANEYLIGGYTYCAQGNESYTETFYEQADKEQRPWLNYAYSDRLMQEKALLYAWFFKDGSQTSTITYADFL
jgi:hypothetical protein